MVPVPESEILCAIPARYRSSRFPGKPLTDICGKPMIVHVAETAKAVLDWVVVATDDERIRSVCKEWGIDSELTSEHHLTGTDRVAELAANLGARRVINVQGDEPLLTKQELTTFVRGTRNSKSPIVNAMARLPDEIDAADVTIPKVAALANGQMIYISRSIIPNFSKAKQRPPLFRQIGIYAFSEAALRAFTSFGGKGFLEESEDIEILRFLDLGMPVSMVQLNDYGPAVDLPEHVAVVEDVMRKRAQAS